MLPITTAPAAYDPSGYVVYPNPPLLVARRFNLRSLRMEGEPATLAEGVASAGPADYLYSISGSGSLAFRTAALGTTQIGVYDRNGKRVSSIGEPADYSNPALSPNGKRLAVGIRDTTGNRDIWIFDLDRGSRSRFIRHPQDDFNPVWSPDGSRIAFASNRRGSRDLYVKPVDSTAEEQVLLEAAGDQSPEQWSPDGRWLLFNDSPAASGRMTLKALALDASTAGKTQVTITQGRYTEFNSSISPDGRFIAYDSDYQDVYVRTFPPTPARWQVSVNGGREPHWSRDGRELYYTREGAVWAASVSASGDRVAVGTPRQLFKIRMPVLLRNRLVVAADGRFLINASVDEPGLEQPDPVTVVLNWRSLVK